MCGREECDVSLEDLYRAYQDCRRRKKGSSGAKAFEPYAIHNLCTLRDEINGRRYRLRPSQCFIISTPVKREVFCAAFRDRIVQHLIYNELNPIIERMLIRDTCSCRVGKGTDHAIDRLATFMRRETGNWNHDALFMKVDLSGFFMSLDREIILRDILWVVDNAYTGRFSSVLRYLLPIIVLSDVTVNATPLCPLSEWEDLPKRKTLFGNPRGLPIGNITSQMFANFYLNDMDHLVKSRHRSYVRFVDDMGIVDTDRRKLEETLELMSAKLAERGVRTNPRKTFIGDVRYGMDYLGVKVRPKRKTLTRRRIGRMWLTSRRFSDAEEAFRSCAGRKGMLERYHGRRIAQRWYMSLQPEIRERLKMDSDAHFVLVGARTSRRTMVDTIRLWAKGD